MLARVDDALASPNLERRAWAALGAVVVAYVAAALYLTRGATFTFDELTWLVDSDGFAPSEIFEPHYGHLIATTRLLYSVMLTTIGAEQMVVQISVIVAVAATSILLYALAKRRIGPLAALAPAVLVLFLGSTPEVLFPSVMSFPQATAFGLGALLALDRRDRPGDIGACALLTCSVASLEVGLAFAAAAAVIVLLDERRLRRLWVVGIPILFFGVWWLWARQFDESLATFSNVLLIPSYAADSLAAGTSAMTGLGHVFIDRPGSSLAIEWGRTLGPVLVGVVVWRLLKRGRSAQLLGSIAILLTLWVGFALGYGFLRTPDADRYAYPVVIAILLILVETFRDTTVTRSTLAGLLAAMLFALPANLYAMRDLGTFIRDNSTRIDAAHAAIQIERSRVSPDFSTDLGLLDTTTAGQYLGFVDEYGPLASSPEQVEAKPVAVRGLVDDTLVAILRLRIEDAPPAAVGSCQRLDVPSGQVEVPLSLGGAILRSSLPAEVGLSRFGASPIRIRDGLRQGRYGILEIPTDSEPVPWVATVKTDAGALDLCSIGGESN